ncbi:MAG TPA: antitoxin [Nocardioides sp.]|jgi:hypothetical protein|nr:antitoxin [Nocardioides sp.]
MTENPSDQPSDPSEKPPIAETIRAKLDEYEVDRRLNELAQQVESVVREGVAKVGEVAHEHRDDIRGFIDKAADALDRRTEGKHAERISQVRGQLERGVERIAEQRPDDTDVPPPSAPWPEA